MNNELANWQRNAAALGMVAIWMKTFAAEIIGHVLNGGVLDRETVDAIKADCIHEIKNLDVIGFEITEEADMLRKAIQQFGQLADIAISEGWKLKNE